ncbi:MAG TPA: PAS domain S-box protein [Candidatus Aminicenantes bacterium]|nr:PAS domain S-box protein [Candidatus Aminicenantes bacterium]
MKNKSKRSEDAAVLLRKAEALARKQVDRTSQDIAFLSPEEIGKILHELRVHQIELEMQNEELRTAQAEIEGMRARYFDLYDMAPVGYITVSEKGLILEANLTAAGLLGVNRGELPKQPLTRLILKEDQDIYYLHRKKLFEGGEPQLCELRLAGPDGAAFWARLQATFAKGPDGEPLCRVAISDISEYKRAEEFLKSNYALLQIAGETAGFGGWIVDLKKNICTWSDAVADIHEMPHGYAPPVEEGISFYAPEWRKKITRVFNDCAQKGIPYNEEMEIITSKGKRVWVRTIGRAVKDENGRITKVQGSFQDITASKQAERELVERKELLTAIYRNAPLVMMVVNADRRIQQINGFATQFAGRDAEDVLGLRGGEALRCMHVLDDPRGCGFGDFCQRCVIRNSVLDTLETGKTYLQIEAPYFYQEKDNKIKEMTFLTSTTPILVKGTRMVLVTLQDITEQKQAEKQLKESEERFRALHNASFGGIAIHDKGLIIECNQGLSEITGYSLDELIGMDGLLLIAPETRDLVMNNILSDYEKPYEAVGLRKNGELFPLRLEARNIPYKGKTVRIVEFRDITESKRAQEALHRIEWMLSKESAALKNDYTQPYGDLSEFNTSRLILDSVGKRVLETIANDFLRLPESSAAVYEKNGDHALGLFASSWCRFMDQASRQLCGTNDITEAMTCGKWLCHDCCWKEASQPAMASGRPVDIACQGGIRLYALPIVAGGEVIGAINFGYGDPPRDKEKLRELAEKYKVPLDELTKKANEYPSRPAFIIETAKDRLQASAHLIGEIVSRKITEKKILTLNEQLEQTVAEKTRELRERVDELERFHDATIEREFRVKELRDELERLKNKDTK